MRPIFIYVGTAIVAIVIAILAVVVFGPEGTPTGATRAALSPGYPCDHLEGEARERCLTGAGGDAAATAPNARDKEASAWSGRNTRGSGIEGVDSGGVTTQPPR